MTFFRRLEASVRSLANEIVSEALAEVTEMAAKADEMAERARAAALAKVQELEAKLAASRTPRDPGGR